MTTGKIERRGNRAVRVHCEEPSAPVKRDNIVLEIEEQHGEATSGFALYERHGAVSGRTSLGVHLTLHGAFEAAVALMGKGATLKIENGNPHVVVRRA